MRRLLLLPAFALVLLGAPVIALQQPAAPAPGAPTVSEVPLPSAQDTTVQPGFTEQVPVDASMVGVTWEGDPAATFRVEVKEPDGTWQPAESVGAVDAMPDEGSPDAARAASIPHEGSEPIWVGDADEVRVSVEGGVVSDVKVAAVDSTPGEVAAPPGSAAAFGSIVQLDGPDRYAFAIAVLVLAVLLGALALGWSPWRRGRSRRALVVVALAALALTACRPITPPGTTSQTQPGIHLRSEWGAAPPACTNPNTDPLKFAVVHHTVNSNSYGPGDSASMIRGMQAYHQGTLGYCDIAYNFLVDKYGQIFEGRWGGINKVVLGAHTGGFNTHSTGIALIGDYRSASISQAQRTSLVHLLQWKLAKHGVYDINQPFTQMSRGAGSRWPSGQIVTLGSHILGHTDLWPTECPGPNVMSQLPSLRSSVQAGIVRPTTTTAAPPAT